MEEKDTAYSKREKEKRIKKEITKLKKIYKDCDENHTKFATSLIENAAFMIVTLEDLREEINENGCTSEYQNGENQWGKKKSPEVETYNTMQKNHAALMKQLTDMIPKPDVEDGEKEADDGFDEFVNAR